jgi:hypothetical protein
MFGVGQDEKMCLSPKFKINFKNSLFLIFIFLSFCQKEKEEKIVVPRLIGKNIEEVKKKYPYIKLNVLSYNQDPKYPKDVIYSQSPPAGEVITKKEFINIEVSQGWLPKTQLLNFDGRITSVRIDKEGIILEVEGYVYNPSSTPFYLNYFYYTPYDFIGRKYDTKRIDINQWLMPATRISRKYKYLISYEKIFSGIKSVKLDSLIVGIVVGCVYETREGRKCIQKEINPQKIKGLIR